MHRARLPWVLSLVAACGGGPPAKTGPTAADPRMAPSDTVARVRQRLGSAAQNCGEAVQGSEDQGCRAQPVLECVHAAFQAARPAHGTFMYATAEGDPVRLDYFVVLSGGRPKLALVSDRTADPVGDKSIDEHECAEVRWGEHAERAGCQTLVPDRCALRSRTPRGARR